MAGKIDVGDAYPNPNIHDGRAYADGVDAAFRLGPTAAAAAGYPGGDAVDPQATVAYDKGITDAAAGMPADSSTAYAGLTATNPV